MKNYTSFRHSIYFGISVLLFLVSSCKPACKEGDCFNGGVCGDSGCQCVGSYTGKNCETNACKGVVCNNGTCVNGVCSCKSGYEGSDCLTEVQAKFIGTYAYTSTLGKTGTCSIQKDGPTQDEEVLINPILDPFNYSHSLLCSVSGNGITVQSQYLLNSTIAEGSGQINGTVITLNMKYKRTGDINFTNCVYTFTR
jgi:hypothetical protein